MLVERVFELGGILTIVFGAALAVLLYATDAGSYGVGIFLGPLLLIGFGAFFIGVGRQARADRQALLALAGGSRGTGPAQRPPPGGG